MKSDRQKIVGPGHESASEIAHLLCQAARDSEASVQEDDITAVVVKRA